MYYTIAPRTAANFTQKPISIYCSVSLSQRQAYRTAVVTVPVGVTTAQWNQAFMFNITDLEDALCIAIYTYDRFSSDGK
jgi:hypothetical protein